MGDDSESTAGRTAFEPGRFTLPLSPTSRESRLAVRQPGAASHPCDRQQRHRGADLGQPHPRAVCGARHRHREQSCGQQHRQVQRHLRVARRLDAGNRRRRRLNPPRTRDARRRHAVRPRIVRQLHQQRHDGSHCQQSRVDRIRCPFRFMPPRPTAVPFRLVLRRQAAHVRRATNAQRIYVPWPLRRAHGHREQHAQVRLQPRVRPHCSHMAGSEGFSHHSCCPAAVHLLQRGRFVGPEHPRRLQRRQRLPACAAQHGVRAAKRKLERHACGGKRARRASH